MLDNHSRLYGAVYKSPINLVVDNMRMIWVQHDAGAIGLMTRSTHKTIEPRAIVLPFALRIDFGFDPQIHSELKTLLAVDVGWQESVPKSERFGPWKSIWTKAAAKILTRTLSTYLAE
ncbi:hypothetical protein AC578_2540 [Pseudocercospora eumusae]|uniref:Uncharacterized protein n=1 Tax=Pseudocercospora eumusae TaxID=321146 RepID=A0A139HHP3_9PEZI|nr:hypothetical protein AC578_2540 [Pseudocercospora eumusae]